MYEITIEAFAKRLAEINDEKFAKAMRVAVEQSLQWMTRDVVLNRMSGPGHGLPDKLGVVTGTARRSIARELQASIERITGAFGSPLKYVRAHEEGFQGQVAVRGHYRNLTRASYRAGKLTKAAATRLKGRLRGGGMGGTFVQPHTMRMNIQAKRFIRTTLHLGIPGLERRAQRAMAVLLETGKVPAAADLGE